MILRRSVRDVGVWVCVCVWDVGVCLWVRREMCVSVCVGEPSCTVIRMILQENTLITEHKAQTPSQSPLDHPHSRDQHAVRLRCSSYGGRGHGQLWRKSCTIIHPYDRWKMTERPPQEASVTAWVGSKLTQAKRDGRWRDVYILPILSGCAVFFVRRSCLWIKSADDADRLLNKT